VHVGGGGEQKSLGGLSQFLVVYVRDLIMCFKFGDDRFRGLASVKDHILPFPIDFDCRPYNTLTLRPLSRILWKIRLDKQKFRLISGLAEFLRKL